MLEDPPQLAIEEVVALYRSVGWSRYANDPETLQRALDGSATVVVARAAERLVGLARVVGDGATICYLQDLLVTPEFQRKGVGRALVEAVLAPHASALQKVVLTDNEPGQRAFYEALGYREIRDVNGGHLRAFVRFDA